MDKLPRRFESPLYTLAVISSVIFLTEMLVMLLASLIPFQSRTHEAVVDAALITILTVPVMYLYYTKPLLRIIDEKNRTATALKDSEQRFRDVALSIGDWLWETDAEGRYAYVSFKMTNTLGYAVEEVIGKTPFDFMVSEEAARVQGLFRQVLADRKPIVDLENWNITKDGRSVCLLTNGVPIIDGDGRFFGYRGVDKDITKKKQMEEALLIARKQEATAILAGGIAHDFRNLLTVIQGNVDLVLMLDKVDKDGRHMLEAARVSLSSAKDLVDQFLTFSSGGNRPHQRIALDKILENTLLMMNDERPASIRRQMADDLWSINGNLHQTALIFRHLLANAREAMPDGGEIVIAANNIELSQKTRMVGYSMKPGRYVRISVSDPGKGIPRDELHKVFDAYHSTKQRGEQRGMGLGLTLTYSIVKDHGGYISIMSEEGTGTTVDVYLPAA